MALFDVTLSNNGGGTFDIAFAAGGPVPISGTDSTLITGTDASTNFAKSASDTTQIAQSSSPGGQPSFIQEAVGDSTTNDTQTATFGTPATAGNIIWCVVGFDKDAGTISDPSGTWNRILANSSSSVSLYMAWKVSVGGETAITVTNTTATPAGNTIWIGEYAATGSEGWEIKASATNPTNETSNTSWSSGTTGNATGDGFAIAGFAIDTGNNGSGTAFSNSYSIREPFAASTGRSTVAIGELSSVLSGNTTSTTVSHDTADQVSGAVAVFGRAAGTLSPDQVVDIVVGDGTIPKFSEDPTQITGTSVSTAFAKSASDTTLITGTDASESILAMVSGNDSGSGSTSPTELFGDTFEGISNGVSLDAGNTDADSIGGSGGTAVASTSQAHTGTVSAYLSSSAQSVWMDYQPVAEQLLRVRIYIKPSTIPTGTNVPLIAFKVTSSGNTIGQLTYNTTGKVKLQKGTTGSNAIIGSNSTLSLSTTEWNRVEVELNGANISAKIFVGDAYCDLPFSTTDGGGVETLAGGAHDESMGSGCSSILIGANSVNTIAYYIDDISIDDTSWPGPTGSTMLASSDSSSIDYIELSGSDTTEISSTETSALTLFKTSSDSGGSGGGETESYIAYGFDENTGTTSEDFGTSGIDLVSIPGWAAGHTGYAMSASDTAGGTFTLPSSISGDWTFMAWIKYRNNGGWTSILEKGGDYPLEMNDGSLDVYFVTGSLFIDGGAFPEDTWTHCAVVNDTTAGTLRLVIGGTTNNSVSGNASLSSGTWDLGGSSAQHLDGEVDDFRIITTALSNAQIADYMGWPVPHSASVPSLSSDDVGAVDTGGPTEKFSDDPTLITGTDVSTNFAKSASDTTLITGTDVSTNFAKSASDTTLITGTDVSTNFAKSTSDTTLLTGTDASDPIIASVDKFGSDTTEIAGTESTSGYITATGSDTTLITGTDASTSFAKSVGDSTLVTGTDESINFSKTASDTTLITGIDVSTEFAKSASDSTLLAGTDVSGTIFVNTTASGSDSTEITGTESFAFGTVYIPDEGVIFSDDFERADGPVGNGWTGTGTITSGDAFSQWTDTIVHTIPTIGSQIIRITYVFGNPVSGYNAPSIELLAPSGPARIQFVFGDGEGASGALEFRDASDDVSSMYGAPIFQGINTAGAVITIETDLVTYGKVWLDGDLFIDGLVSSGSANMAGTTFDKVKIYQSWAGSAASISISGGLPISDETEISSTESSSIVISGLLLKSKSDSTKIRDSISYNGFNTGPMPELEGWTGYNTIGINISGYGGGPDSEWLTLYTYDNPTGPAGGKSPDHNPAIESGKTLEISYWYMQIFVGDQGKTITFTIEFLNSGGGVVSSVSDDRTLGLYTVPTYAKFYAIVPATATGYRMYTTVIGTTTNWAIDGVTVNYGSELNVALAGTDSTLITGTDSSNAYVNLPGTDATLINSVEAGSVVISGTVLVSGSDTTDLTGTDASTQFAKSASDTTLITGIDASTNFAKSAADVTLITGADVSTAFAKSAIDATLITGTEGSIISSTLIGTDSTVITVAESTSGFITAAGSDTTNITVTETTSGNITASAADATEITSDDVGSKVSSGDFQKLSDDTTEIGSSETSSLAYFLNRDDTTQITVTETVAFGINAFSTSDDTEIGSSEVSYIFNDQPGSDTTLLGSDEAGSKVVSGGQDITGADETEITGTSASTEFAKSTADSTVVTGTDTSTQFAKSTSDTTTLSGIDESTAFAKSASDSTVVTGTETTEITVGVTGVDAAEGTYEDEYGGTYTAYNIWITDSGATDITGGLDITGSDATEIGSSESSALDITAFIIGTDTTEITATETSSFATISAVGTDTTQITVTESVAFATINAVASDSTQISVVEHGAVFTDYSGTDATELDVVETTDIVTSGSATKSGSDATQIVGSESADVAVLVSINASDFTLISSTEGITFGTLPITGSDSTVITGTESVAFGVNAFGASDTTQITGTESSALFRYIPGSDATEISVVESVSVNLSLYGTDSTEISSDDSGQLSSAIVGEIIIWSTTDSAVVPVQAIGGLESEVIIEVGTTGGGDPVQTITETGSVIRTDVNTGREYDAS